jgi:hypothetical protein
MAYGGRCGNATQRVQDLCVHVHAVDYDYDTIAVYHGRGWEKREIDALLIVIVACEMKEDTIIIN